MTSTDDLPWATLTGPDGTETPVVQGGTYDSADAAVDYGRQATAIEPSRVLVLDNDEQHTLLIALERWEPGSIDADRLQSRVSSGDEYTDEIDEMARITLRKRRLAAEIVRINKRIDALTEPTVDRLTEFGAKSMRHDGTGALVMRDDLVRLAHRDSDWSKEEKAAAKEAAGDVLAAQPETEDLVEQTWAHRRVEAYYRGLYQDALEAEQAKPEDERRPVEADSVIPEAMRAFYKLDVTPRITVRAS